MPDGGYSCNVTLLLHIVDDSEASLDSKRIRLSDDMIMSSGRDSAYVSQHSDTCIHTCCSMNCFQMTGPYELQSIRKSFKCRSQLQQQQFLLDATCNGGGIENDKLCLFGKSMCKQAFAEALGISMKRLRRVNHLYLDGVRVIPPQIDEYRKMKSDKYEAAKAWMHHYFNKIGDRMPHIEQLHLPSFLSKKAVYDMMVDDFSQEGIKLSDIISQSHFYKIWKNDFTNVIIPKV